MTTWLIACEGAREIPGSPGYLVTPDGRIFGCRTNHGMRDSYREMKPSADAKGYLGLTICGPSGARRKVRVHRIVAEIFVPNPECKPCVRHMDGSKTNNNVSNLAWGTYAENEADKKMHGTYDTRRNGKLTQQDRDAVPKLYKQGLTHQDIAEIFKVSRPAISRLLSGKTWA